MRKRKLDAEKLLEYRDKRDKTVDDTVKRKKEQSVMLKDSVVEKDIDETPSTSSSIPSSSSSPTTVSSSTSSFVPSSSTTTSNIHVFYTQSVTKLNVKICLFDDCRQEVSFTTGSTSHLHEHVNNRHTNEYSLFRLAKSKEECESILKKANDSFNKSQLRLDCFIRKAENLPEEIQKRNLNWLLITIVHGISFNFSGGKDVLDHMRLFHNSTYQNRNELSSATLEGLYHLCRLQVKKILKNVSSVCLTADGWTSITMESYLAITCHWISQDWELKRATLGLIQLFGKKTGVFLKEIIEKKANELLSKECVIIGIVVDNGANYNLAMKEIIGEEDNNCFAHTLQLSMQTTLSMTPWLGEISKVKDVVKFVKFHHQLRDKFGKGSCQLDCPTRWFSVYQMLLKFKENLSKYKELENEIEPSMPNMETVDSILFVTKPFIEAIKFTEAEKYLTASEVPQILSNLVQSVQLKETDTILIKELKQQLHKDLTRRLGHILTTPNEYLYASCFDPRYGDLEFITEELRNKVWQKLEKEIDDIDLEKSSGLYPIGNLTDDLKLMRKFFEFNAKQFKAMQKFDVLKWWKDFNRGALLAPYAKMYLCRPATSASSERVFKSAGYTYTEERTRLESEKVQEMVFIKENKGLLPKEIGELLNMIGNLKTTEIIDE